MNVGEINKKIREHFRQRNRQLDRLPQGLMPSIAPLAIEEQDRLRWSCPVCEHTLVYSSYRNRWEKQ